MILGSSLPCELLPTETDAPYLHYPSGLFRSDIPLISRSNFSKFVGIRCGKNVL